MKLNLITFASSLASRESVFADHKKMLDKIAKKYEVNYIFPEDLGDTPPEGLTMVFVGSGGVEEMVAANINRLPQYVVLIADGLKNSLAASLEILSWLRLEGRNGRVIHGTLNNIIADIDEIAEIQEIADKIRGQRVGVIGKPSGWLIASGVDYEAVRDKWGVELVDCKLSQVVELFKVFEFGNPDEVYNSLIKKAEGVKETTREGLMEAMKLSVILNGMCSIHNLDAFTVNCFDLIPELHTTGCLALSDINGFGIPAGCEGDIQTLLTMLVVKAATGQPSFMANPSQIISKARQEMVFAHCTITRSMTDRFFYRSHYESGIGAAIQGIIDPTEVTVVKCGGRKMENFFVSEALVLDCPDDPAMCRTQLKLRLDEPLDYFLNRSIGNHHVIVRGDHCAKLSKVFKFLGSNSVI